MLMDLYSLGLALYFVKKIKHTENKESSPIACSHIVRYLWRGKRELIGCSANKISVMLIYLSPIISLFFVCQYIQAEIMRCFAKAGFE